MVGLLLSILVSLTNVLTDICRKKVLDGGSPAALVSFWCKALSILICAAVMGGLTLAAGRGPEIPDLSSALGLPNKYLAFGLYLLFSGLLEGIALFLNLRAFQVSPISYCLPFMALTPIFLLPGGWLLLNEPATPGMLLGVLVVVIGSLVVNRQLFAKGLLEPVRAIIRERGSRYMVIVAMLLAATNLLDKWFVSRGGGTLTLCERAAKAILLANGKAVVMSGLFCLMALWQLGKRQEGASQERGVKGFVASVGWSKVLRAAPGWLLLASSLETIVLTAQFMAVQLTVAALVISIKRSGILLAVILGALIFKERDIRDRLIASLVMVSGVAIFFLAQPSGNQPPILALRGAVLLTLAVLSTLAVVLKLCSTPQAQETSAKVQAPPMAKVS